MLHSWERCRIQLRNVVRWCRVTGRGSGMMNIRKNEEVTVSWLSMNFLENYDFHHVFRLIVLYIATSKFQQKRIWQHKLRNWEPPNYIWDGPSSFQRWGDPGTHQYPEPRGGGGGFGLNRQNSSSGPMGGDCKGRKVLQQYTREPVQV